MISRPLRSVWLGNPRYLSVYGLGVAQAMSIMGHWHRAVSLFDEASIVAKQLAEMAPDVIWTHMALWPPKGALTVEQILGMLASWKQRGAAVFLHDGDPRERDVSAHDVGAAFSIALVNRTIIGGHHLGLPALRWPYAAMVQRRMLPVGEVEHDLLFAGIMRRDGLYGPRTGLIDELREKLGAKMHVVSPNTGDVNNRMQVVDVVAKTGAVLGLARPEVSGWVDTRVFQYPGAGGVLIHDDAGEFLVPDEHYLKFDRYCAVESILKCVDRARRKDGADAGIRERAFKHVQASHTWVQRCQTALEAFFGRGM